jgi:hypothetical protein
MSDSALTRDNLPLSRLTMADQPTCVYRKLKLGRSGGEVRREWRVI